MNKRNLVPVTVWKHVRRKKEVSRVSIPDRCEGGTPMADGVKDLVMA